MNQIPGTVLPERIHAILDPWIASQPEAIALEDADGRLSFGELAAAIAATAECLRGAGLRPGDRLLVVCENCIAAVVLVFAASRLEAWVSLVNARLSPREIDTFIAHSGARRSLFLSATSTDAAQHAQRLGAVTVDWPGCGALAIAPLVEDCQPEPVHASGALQVAALIYTSGTSGHPKGVMLSHRNLAFVAENNRVLRSIHPGDRVYGVLPLAHVYGLTSIMLTVLHCGATLVLAARFEPQRLARALAEDGITVLHGVPAIYAKLLDWARRSGTPLLAPRLRIAQAGGAPLDQALKDDFERAFGVVLHHHRPLAHVQPHAGELGRQQTDDQDQRQAAEQ
ncbi:MAG: AMP-binding protein [Proteobacteria bacterium]|nr:AMP-binding protein [Pseudomonadota bacterium]